MNLIRLSVKNATSKWWRSFTLGFLIFVISFVMVITSSLITTITSKTQNVIMNGLTGHIQIRSNASMEGDMVEQYSRGWDAIKPIDSSVIPVLQKVVDADFPTLSYSFLVRQNVSLVGEKIRDETLLIGIDSQFNQYKDAFVLKEGRYLQPSDTHAILLTEEQAGSFNARIGDTITVSTKNRFGLNAQSEFQVVGIGQFVMLSLFSYKAAYVPIQSMRELISIGQGQITDMILFHRNPSSVNHTIEQISEHLNRSGIKAVVTAKEQLTSEAIKVKDLDYNEDSDLSVKISGYDEMGKSFRGIGDTLFIVLIALVIFLMIIVSILITNLVYMMGLERYREIGTLRAIGFTRFQVIRIFMGEILFISLASTLFGVLTSIGCVLWLGSAGLASPIPALEFFMGKTLNLALDPTSILLILGVITGFTLISSFYPSYKACAVDPAETIRTV